MPNTGWSSFLTGHDVKQKFFYPKKIFCLPFSTSTLLYWTKTNNIEFISLTEKPKTLVRITTKRLITIEENKWIYSEDITRSLKLCESYFDCKEDFSGNEHSQWNIIVKFGNHNFHSWNLQRADTNAYKW